MTTFCLKAAKPFQYDPQLLPSHRQVMTLHQLDQFKARQGQADENRSTYAFTRHWGTQEKQTQPPETQPAQTDSQTGDPQA